MFEVGFWEMILIGIVGLLVFGPEKLPRVARELGLWARKARSVVSSVKREIDHELEIQELQESLNQRRRSLNSLTIDAMAERLTDLAKTGSESEPLPGKEASAAETGVQIVNPDRPDGT